MKRAAQVLPHDGGIRKRQARRKQEVLFPSLGYLDLVPDCRMLIRACLPSWGTRLSLKRTCRECYADETMLPASVTVRDAEVLDRVERFGPWATGIPHPLMQPGANLLIEQGFFADEWMRAFLAYRAHLVATDVGGLYVPSRRVAYYLPRFDGVPCDGAVRIPVSLALTLKDGWWISFSLGGGVDVHERYGPSVVTKYRMSLGPVRRYVYVRYMCIASPWGADDVVFFHHGCVYVCLHYIPILDWNEAQHPHPW